jgi:hypothetical protein
LIRKISSILAAIAFILTGLVAPAGAADSAKGSLSPYGQRAVIDLASCLRTSSSLDVYYLIDNSNSLADSDKPNQRQKIIQQDIKRWGDIAGQQAGLSVRIAGSFFNSRTQPISSWQAVTKENAVSVGESFTQAINNSNLGEYTNWLAGLTEAKSQLAGSQAICKAVIWFTDGGLWMPGTNTKDRSKSLDAVAALCGGGSQGALASVPSAQGIVAQMRTEHIHIFGILLHVGKDKTPNEAYYRSLMQPIIEETGQVSVSGGLPGGNFVCGENTPADQRHYAAGAFLQATSAADVAYSFMTIPSLVSGGSQEAMDCVGSGEFYVDPGIDSFELSTDATSWTITDEKGSLVTKSPANFAADGTYTTGRIQVPHLKKSQKWKFSPSGGLGKCQLFVYPELELVLHSKALIAGKKSSVTGQFVKSAISGEKADLTVYSKVEFHAFVNKRDYSAAQLDAKTGAFTIRDYTPTSSDVEKNVLFGASLKLATEHYDLYPINFEQDEQVFNAASLPQIGDIKFVKGIKSAKDQAVAQVKIAPPASPGLSSSVCFDGYSVIADHQDESAGKATNRQKDWKWSASGLDANGCVDVLMGTNKPQVITFKVSNPKQANSHVSALFDYRISAGDLTGVKDSQTASFDTQTKTSAPLFWLWLLGLLIAGVGIPFGVLTVINFLNSRVIVTGDDQVAEFDLEFDLESRQISLYSLRSEQLEPDGKRVDAFASGLNLALDFRGVYQGEQNRSFVMPGPGGVKVSAKPSWWPLNSPRFLATVSQPNLLLLSRVAPNQVVNPNSLPNGKIGDLSYIIYEPASNTGKSISGRAVLAITQSPDRAIENYIAAVQNLCTNVTLKEILKSTVESSASHGGPAIFVDGISAGRDSEDSFFSFTQDSQSINQNASAFDSRVTPQSNPEDFDFKF